MMVRHGRVRLLSGSSREQQHFAIAGNPWQVMASSGLRTGLACVVTAAALYGLQRVLKGRESDDHAPLRFKKMASKLTVPVGSQHAKVGISNCI